MSQLDLLVANIRAKGFQSTKRARSGRKRERALRPGSRTHLGRGGQSANSVKLYKISSWEPEEASFNLPCLLILAPSWMLGLPSPTRPSWRRRRGGHCANRPFCHSDEARDREERITWSCATKRPVSGLSASCSPTIFLGAGEVGRAGVEGLEACREISGLPGPSSAKFGFRGGRIFITPIKNLPSRWEVVAECLKEGAMGPGRGTRSRREGEKQLHRQRTQTNS